MNQMTDDQFREFLVALSARQGDHDMLVRMDANIINLKQSRDEDLIRLGKAERTAEKAHERLDKYLIIGGGSILLTVVGLVFTVFKG